MRCKFREIPALNSTLHLIVDVLQQHEELPVYGAQFSVCRPTAITGAHWGY